MLPSGRQRPKRPKVVAVEVKLLMLPLLQKIRGQKDQIRVSVGRDSTERAKKYSVSTNVIQLWIDKSKNQSNTISNIDQNTFKNPNLSFYFFSAGSLRASLGIIQLWNMKTLIWNRLFYSEICADIKISIRFDKISLNTYYH